MPQSSVTITVQKASGAEANNESKQEAKQAPVIADDEQLGVADAVIKPLLVRQSFWRYIR
nr:hypothetical protein [Psychrobacter sp. PraFG1]UNK05109.1 hypothetical protein MN210_14025 [Psychrobacter sp. PraFG1]